MGDRFAAARATARAGRAFAQANDNERASVLLIRAGRSLQAMGLEPPRWRPLLEEAAERAAAAGMTQVAETARRWAEAGS